MLEGTIATPLGHIPKKYAAIGGGVLLLVIAVGYYRHKKAASTAAATNSANGSIDPATGFVYGSPEDQAALAAQGTAAAGTTVTTGGAGAIGSTPPLVTVGGPFTNNAQWAQSAEQYLTGNGLVSDPTMLSAALGLYITGEPVPQDDASVTSLIEQAIAIEGYPPVAGANGYPPHINTNNPTPPSPPTTNPTPPPTPPPTTPPSTNPPTTTNLPKRRYVMTGVFPAPPATPPWNTTLSGINSHLGWHPGISAMASWNGISNINIIPANHQLWVDPPGNYSGSVEVF